MSSINQPGEYDAVLGNKEVNTGSAVLGGIEGVKQRLLVPIAEHRIAALNEALKYDDKGLNLVIHALDDADILVRTHAYKILERIEAPEIHVILDRFRKKYYLVSFDGVYQSKFDKHYMVYYYIRFYLDGTVITVGSIGNAEQISKWFNKESENKNFGSGTYIVGDSCVKFSSHSTCGTVDYFGEINTVNNTIFVQWYNHINNRSGNDEYCFVKLLS